MANRWKGNFVVATEATSSGTDYTGKANGAWSLNNQIQQKQAGLWAKGQTLPNAPTGVSATIGNAQSIVSFTSPTDTGGQTITGYTVTSSTGGITATGASSPITITGLTNGTAYTFTVTATNASGNSTASSPSNSVTPSAGVQIGDPLGGGYYAGKISTAGNGVADYYLIVAPKATGQTTATWGPVATTTGITNTITGPTNSASLAALGASYAAATFCEGVAAGGYNDWYLPAKNELEVLYYFLKPTTDASNTSYGANPNAVAPEPINTNHTATDPSQTTALAFRSGGAEALTAANYSSSTEASNYGNFVCNMTNGPLFGNDKNISINVRAVRRLAV